MNPCGPHYEVPNLTSMLYEYTNKEAERILMGFRKGNFVSLRDLPNDFNYGNVLNAQRDKIEHNIKEKAEPKLYVELLGGGGYFSKFEWKEDPYGLFLEKQYYENFIKREKQKAVHGDHVYLPTTKMPAPFKFVSPFDSSSGTNGMWCSFLYNDDPYESTKLEIMKNKWLEDSKILYGDFKPS